MLVDEMFGLVCEIKVRLYVQVLEKIDFCGLGCFRSIHISFVTKLCHFYIIIESVNGDS